MTNLKGREEIGRNAKILDFEVAFVWGKHPMTIWAGDLI